MTKAEQQVGDGQLCNCCWQQTPEQRAADCPMPFECLRPRLYAEPASVYEDLATLLKDKIEDASVYSDVHWYGIELQFAVDEYEPTQYLVVEGSDVVDHFYSTDEAVSDMIDRCFAGWGYMYRDGHWIPNPYCTHEIGEPQQIKTADLRPNDIVAFADLLDVVQQLDLPTDGSVVATVHVLRRGMNEKWYAGIDAVQTVRRPG
jgi:hypothetical protein